MVQGFLDGATHAPTRAGDADVDRRGHGLVLPQPSSAALSVFLEYGIGSAVTRGPPMKLYSAYISPYASRARMAVYAKGIDVEILPAPGGRKSAEFLAMNPMGKVPCLITDEGAAVPESGIIVEYLEALYPERPLTPACPDQATRSRLIARIGETYVLTPLSRLFGQLDPATRDEEVVGAAIAEMEVGLGYLELYLDDEGPYATGEYLTLADCQLAPTLFYVRALGPLFGKDWLNAFPRVGAYLKAVRADETVARINAEMKDALAHYQATGEFR
jgi:glutathione S-transferase